MPLEVLHVLGSAALEATGIARLVATLAAGLDPRAYRLHVSFLGADGPLRGDLARSGMSVRALDWQGGARDPAGARRFWRHIRSQRFAIIHQHAGGRAVRWVARAASDASLIVHVHGTVLEPTGTRMRPITTREADAVIATSRAVADRFPHPRVRVVHPGVPPSDVSPVAASLEPSVPIVVGTAGRLVRLKGHVDLLRAAAMLERTQPAVRVEIAGDGPERLALEDAARQLGLEQRVTFLGWTRDLRPVMARWHVLAQPSLEEGFGMAVLEGMAEGLPVVATQVGGLPELVDDGTTGLLVPPGDPPALAKALQWLMEYPDRRSAMGAAGRERARAHFSAARMVGNVAEIYGELADLRLVRRLPPRC